MKPFHQYLPEDDAIQLLMQLELLAFLIHWTFVLIRPFVPHLAWSIVLTVTLYPVLDLLSRSLHGRQRLAAAILTLINLGIVIGPAMWLGLTALDGVTEFAGNLSAGNLAIPSPSESINNFAFISPNLYEFWDQASMDIPAALCEVAAYAALAGFLYPRGAQLIETGRNFLDRIVPEQNEHFFERLGTTIRAES